MLIPLGRLRVFLCKIISLFVGSLSKAAWRENPAPRWGTEEVPKCPERSNAPTCGGQSGPRAVGKVQALRTPDPLSTRREEWVGPRTATGFVDSRGIPPRGARRVRGLGLGDSGWLVVTAALGWPFPAL